MSRLLPFLLGTAIVMGSGAPAAAQTPATVRPAVLVTPIPEPFQPRTRPGASDVVRRIASFDADGDDRVARDELPERMQDLTERGDRDGDGFLTAREIEQLVQQAGGDVRSGPLSIRPHSFGLMDIVDDLRLPHPKHLQALAIVKGRAVPRTGDDPASADLLARMRQLLDDEEFENFVAATARAPRANVLAREVVGVLLPTR